MKREQAWRRLAWLPILSFLTAAAPGPETLDKAWDGARAMRDVAALLDMSPRSIGTPGHDKALRYIEDEISKEFPGSAQLQRWRFTAPDGRTLDLTNLIARLQPGVARRIVLGTHYDSIIRAYRDPKDPTAIMPGANNSSSGVALLLETVRAMKALPPPEVGVDVIFFDGEEGPLALGAGDPGWRALGSPYFAQHIADFYPAAKPVAGAIFDMVCYRDLELNPERESLMAAGPEVARFWRIGHEVAPAAFMADPTEYPINDDQTALTLVGIPSFLVIDFKYEPWFNTAEDTIDKCSARSLEAVGRTVLRWAYTM